MNIPNHVMFLITIFTFVNLIEANEKKNFQCVVKKFQESHCRVNLDKARYSNLFYFGAVGANRSVPRYV